MAELALPPATSKRITALAVNGPVQRCGHVRPLAVPLVIVWIVWNGADPLGENNTVTRLARVEASLGDRVADGGASGAGQIHRALDLSRVTVIAVSTVAVAEDARRCRVDTDLSLA